MRVIGTGRFARWNPAYLHIERVAIGQIGGRGLAAQLFGNFFAETREFSLGG